MTGVMNLQCIFFFTFSNANKTLFTSDYKRNARIMHVKHNCYTSLVPFLILHTFGSEGGLNRLSLHSLKIASVLLDYRLDDTGLSTYHFQNRGIHSYIYMQ